jgi:hypothetical protein
MLALLETMRDIDETDVKDEEALTAKQAFTTALAPLASRPSIPEDALAGVRHAASGAEGEAAADAANRWRHNAFRVWTARKPQARSRWNLL